MHIVYFKMLLQMILLHYAYIIIGQWKALKISDSFNSVNL